jgi:hypothetical protein
MPVVSLVNDGMDAMLSTASVGVVFLAGASFVQANFGRNPATQTAEPRLAQGRLDHPVVLFPCRCLRPDANCHGPCTADETLAI